MNASELRINNLLKTHPNDPSIYTVEAIYENTCCFIESEVVFSNEYIFPIELTEEWLIKSGCEKLESHIAIAYTFDRFKLIWKESYNYWYVIDSESLTYLSKVEFVHEFQNLIFALTGKELEIK